MISREFLSILASKGRIEIVRTLRSYPDRDFTINELARTSKVPVMTTWRAVKDLKGIGVIKTRKVGNATSVSMTDDKESLRTLRLIPDTDPQRVAARLYAAALAENTWLHECKLFGNIGRGEHAPGEEIDIAVVYDDRSVSQDEAKAASSILADRIRADTNVTIVPLCIALKDMSRRGGLAGELRDKETIWARS